MRRVASLAWCAAVACAAPAPPCPPVPACPSAAPVPASSSSPAAVAPSASAAPAPKPLPERQKPTAKLFDDGLAEAGFFQRGDAFDLGLDGAALDALVAEAEKTKSDSLVVLRDGKLVAERYFGSRRGPIETMSMTKSMTALAVMFLVEEKKLPSLDVPVAKYVPELAKGKRAKISLRHLLTQSSGLAHGKDAKVLNAQKDRTSYAKRANLVDEPGAVFSYNNEATQLLSIVVEQAAGKPADSYLDDKLFRPLGIRNWQWDRDQAKNVQTYYGLALEARDLARIGQLLLDRGKLGERQLLSPQSVALLSTPSERSPYYGLLWWIRYERVVSELDPAKLVEELAPLAPTLSPLAGRKFRTSGELWLEAGARLSAPERELLARALEAGAPLAADKPDHPIGFYADGSLGQRLAVFEAPRLVVVRQRRRRPPAEENESLSFPSFLKLASALVRSGS